MHRMNMARPKSWHNTSFGAVRRHLRALTVRRFKFTLVHKGEHALEKCRSSLSNLSVLQRPLSKLLSQAASCSVCFTWSPPWQRTFWTLASRVFRAGTRAVLYSLEPRSRAEPLPRSAPRVCMGTHGSVQRNLHSTLSITIPPTHTDPFPYFWQTAAKAQLVMLVASQASDMFGPFDI